MQKVNRLTLSGLVLSIYVVTMILTQSFAFLQFQVRLATGFYALAYVLPFLWLPLSLGNMLSNFLLGGLGFVDIFGGLVVGVLTTLSIVVIKKCKLPKVFTIIPVALIPSVIVPIWLAPILGMPYLGLFLSLLVGQTIAGVFGYVVLRLVGDKLA